MARYRFFEFNQSGLIDRSHEVLLANDVLAHAHAEGLCSRSPVEIWRGRDRIAEIPPIRLAS